MNNKIFFIIHFLVDGYLCCFHFKHIANRASKTMNGQVPVP